MKVTDPGSPIGRPFPPRGIPVPIPTRVRIRLFSSRTEKPQSTLAEPVLQRVRVLQDGLGNSNTRATLLTHAAVRV